jgi:hypothetical protein
MNIKSILAASAIAGMSLLGIGSDAKAITWTLTDVKVHGGGEVSGSFTLDVYGDIDDSVPYDLISFGFKNHKLDDRYKAGEVVGPDITAPNVIDFFSARWGYREELQLTFLNPLTDPINSLVADQSFVCFSWSCPISGENSFNNEHFKGTDREVSGSDLRATPLPTTWTLMLVGLAGLGFAAYRGRSSDPQVATA